jgi:hypothetical protein
MREGTIVDATLIAVPPSTRRVWKTLQLSTKTGISFVFWPAGRVRNFVRRAAVS